MAEFARAIDQKVGAKVLARRNSLGISIELLAARIGVSAITMEKYESGALRIPSLLLVEIASLLRTTLTSFLT